MRLAAIAALIVLSGCDDRPNQWDAFIYPDFEGSDEFEKIAGFKSFELCQRAAQSRIRSLPTPEKADYECGYKCRFNPQYGVDVCKTTRK